eukprot:SAG31_NODE_48880_length_164_cov_24.138462_1_plen_37_part_10
MGAYGVVGAPGVQHMPPWHGPWPMGHGAWGMEATEAC